LPIRPPTPTGAPHKQVRGDPAQARRPRRHDPLRGAITPVRCGLRGHAERLPGRPERRISHTAPRPTVTLRHVVRNPLGRPRPSLPEAFSSIWPYGQVVTSYLRNGHL
jgi:hypothetical protein